MVNSKNKGNTFERRIANLLSDRFEEKTGMSSSFRRNADSGSFFGGTNNKRIETHDTSKASFGDIITPERFVFNIECKHYKTPPTFAAIMKQEIKQFDTWIAQAELDAVSANKMPLIVIKYNNVAEFVLIDHLFGDMTAVAQYKRYYLVALNVLLDQDAGYFFGNIETKKPDAVG